MTAAVRPPVLALLLLVAAPPASPPAGSRAEQQRREYCSLLRGCGLPEPGGACTPAQASGLPGVKYDTERCRGPRLLVARGVGTDGPLGFRLYRFLGRRYQVDYRLEGQLSISVARLNVLLDDLPLAARLLSHFQKVDYAAEYLDRARGRFKGRRGRSLNGEAELVSGSPAEQRLFYFGSGVSELGPWKLRGLGLVEVQYWPSGPGERALAYRMKVLATPSSAFYNFLMNRGLFRAVLTRKVREVLTDIGEASRKLDRAGAAVAADGRWSPAEREKIAALLRLP